MEEDLCGYMDWITQAEDMDDLDEHGNPRKKDASIIFEALYFREQHIFSFLIKSSLWCLSF